MRESIRRQPALQRYAVVGLTGTILLAAGCAATPDMPTASLDAAKTAIATAEKADAGRYAGAELSEAREKLASASSAAQDERMLEAERLAEQSRVTAELASARTESAKATAVNQEMDQGAAALSDEMQRAGEQR